MNQDWAVLRGGKILDEVSKKFQLIINHVFIPYVFLSHNCSFLKLITLRNRVTMRHDIPYSENDVYTGVTFVFFFFINKRNVFGNVLYNIYKDIDFFVPSKIATTRPNTFDTSKSTFSLWNLTRSFMQ